MIEIGVDALNPVQTNAKNMQADKLKSDYGSRLVFWGGIDTHVPHTAHEMEEEVKLVAKVMAPGGGYVLSSIHNIQANVSSENICVMFDTAMKYSL